MLVPAENPTISGFRVECFYHPAGQVGGDFYQVVQTPSGGALLVIGDVSGDEGMPGRGDDRLAARGHIPHPGPLHPEPRRDSEAMNTRMLSRSKGGFTTCLVVRIDPAGTLTAANAGHLAPYLDGKNFHSRMACPWVLPSGTLCGVLVPTASAARLTLISDGIVEARNAQGDLFGFDRTAAISTQSAEAVAQAAQAFGQEDDITVLTLQFAPAEVAHA